MSKFSWSVGHAETTPGKQSPDGVKEWTQVNPIAKLIISELDNYEGVTQKRIDDITGKFDIPLTQRSNTVNAFVPTVHADLHLNASGSGWNDAGGVEVYVQLDHTPEELALAKKIQRNLVAATGFRDRGVKFADFHMLYKVKSNSVLAEMGFMTNKKEAMFIRSIEGQNKIAMAIINAYVEQYKLVKKVKPMRLFSFYTGGYSSAALVEVHNYIKINKWDFKPEKNANGDIMFTVGVFGEGTEAAIRFEKFLKSRGFAYEKIYK